MKRFRNRTFTLLELVVVMSLITVLAALLAPALKSAKDTARSTGCLSNLHQIGIAILMYVSDRGQFPPGQGTGSNPYLPWTNLIFQTRVTNISSIYVDKACATVYQGAGDGQADYFYCPHAMSYFDPIAGWSQRARSPEETFTTVYGGNQVRMSPRVELARDIFNEWVYQNTYNFKGVHRGGASLNVLFMDGHAESKSLTDSDISTPDRRGIWDYDVVYPWF